MILGGDKNDLNLSPLLGGIPKLKQLVTKPTHKSKILDVILTNMHALYSVPVITPPVPPDDRNYGREYIPRIYRPLPESGVREFGEWICSEEWGDISENISPSEQVQEFESIMTTKLNDILPQKSVKLNPFFDKPYITAELKKLDRKVKRIYRRH